MISMKARRAAVACAAACLAGLTITGCQDFLKADNPGAVQETDVNSRTQVGVLMNGAQAEFQLMFGAMAYYSALYSDELRNHHVFFEEKLIDRRAVDQNNASYAAFFYTPLQRARFLADSVTGRLKVVLGDSASRSTRIARTRNYGGFEYIYLAESLCGAPVDGGPVLTPAQLLKDYALPRFAEAITVATAAKATTGVPAAVINAADSLIKIAQIGSARAALDLGDKALAIQFASAVVATTDTAFMFRSYNDSSINLSNTFGSRLVGSSGSKTGSVTSTPYLGMNDRRVPQPATGERVQDALTVVVPNAGRSFSASLEYAPPSVTPVTPAQLIIGADFAQTGWMRIASYREARYILAEAQGNNAANVTFLNAQRALGGDAALGGTAPLVSPTDAVYFASLRDQRRREFFLDAHRLGDLRRYITQYNVNEFQMGAYPGSTSGEQYDTQTCLPLTLAEISGNPNIPKN